MTELSKRVRESRLTIPVAVALLLVLSFGVLRLSRPASVDLPKLFEVASFELVDQRGQPFSSSSLRGRVWIANFIFTSCRDICPMLTTHMGNVASRLSDAPGVRFVSISVDPGVDTPEVLSAYASRVGADASRWSFLTGEPERVREVTERVFRQPFEERVPEGDHYNILHASRLLLIDGDGFVRGSYETHPAGLAKIEADARALARTATP